MQTAINPIVPKSHAEVALGALDHGKNVCGEKPLAASVTTTSTSQRRTTGAILVCHTPDVLTDATADLTMALLLAVARRIPENDRYLRDGGKILWRLEQPLMGRDVSGATIGIVGAARSAPRLPDAQPRSACASSTQAGPRGTRTPQQSWVRDESTSTIFSLLQTL
ncbi:hypothetical protein [Microbacterium sp. LWS13-1.2]|uniref:Gfo/Idh/MocA-like oxidoreductase N-terminal domain-containing protein n=1 Tax=Microbacterium sp. LWS13-1.2 TaxID=3135264 RepID=A0AAU6SAR6_9MICO